MTKFKIVRSEFEQGINDDKYIFKNAFVKEGTEEEVRKYFEKLYLRARQRANVNLLTDSPMVTKSKNEIRMHTINETVLHFKIVKTKEII